MAIIAVAISTADRTSLNSNLSIDETIEYESLDSTPSINFHDSNFKDDIVLTTPKKNSSMYDLLNKKVKFDFSDLLFSKALNNGLRLLRKHILHERVKLDIPQIPMIICNQNCTLVHTEEEIDSSKIYILYEMIADEYCIARFIREFNGNKSDLHQFSTIAQYYDFGINTDLDITKALNLVKMISLDDTNLSNALSVDFGSKISKAILDLDQIYRDYWSSSDTEDSNDAIKIYDKIIGTAVIFENLFSTAVDTEIMKQISVPDNIKGDLTIKVLVVSNT